MPQTASRKIRVLHIAQAAGGVDRYIRMLLKYMDTSRFENILICSYDYKKKDYYGLIVGFEQVDMKREIGIYDVKAIVSVRKAIKKYKPDIVYAHSSKAGAIARIADIGLHNHCIYNPHGWAFNMQCSPIKRKVYITIEHLAAHFCERIICISDAEKESALKYRICSSDKLQVIYNGIDIDECKNCVHRIKRADLGIPDDAFVVGMVGRISKQKAPDIFIRAAKMIKEKVSSAHFILVGSGDMEGEVRKYAADNGFLDSVHITGWVDNSLSYIELFDVACLISRWEGFGLVLPEYMLAGKPIIATNVDAIPNIIANGLNGILVPVDQVEMICEKVIRLKNDDRLINRLCRQAQIDAEEKYDVRRTVKQHCELFIRIQNC